MEEVKVKREKPHKEEIRLAKRKAAKPLLWIGIVSIVMLFAGLTSAYVVRAQNGNWQVFPAQSATVEDDPGALWQR